MCTSVAVGIIGKSVIEAALTMVGRASLMLELVSSSGMSASESSGSRVTAVEVVTVTVAVEATVSVSAALVVLSPSPPVDASGSKVAFLSLGASPAAILSLAPAASAFSTCDATSILPIICLGVDVGTAASDSS